MFEDVDSYILLYAAITACITELLIRYTPVYISRRRFGAIFSIGIGFSTAAIHGTVCGYSFAQILWRGLLATAISNFIYDNAKTILKELIKNSLGGVK